MEAIPPSPTLPRRVDLVSQSQMPSRERAAYAQTKRRPTCCSDHRQAPETVRSHERYQKWRIRSRLPTVEHPPIAIHDKVSTDSNEIRICCECSTRAQQVLIEYQQRCYLYQSHLPQAAVVADLVKCWDNDSALLLEHRRRHEKTS